MGSAQLDILAIEQVAQPAEPPHEHTTSDLRQQMAQRLALHRERRRTLQPEINAAPTPERSRRNPIAAAVAQRYAQSPSYRAVLGEQAQRAIDEATRKAESAAAEAEVAARNALAIAAAQQELLAELELWTAPQQFTTATAQTLPSVVARALLPRCEISQASLTVRLAGDLLSRSRIATEEASTNAVPQPGQQDDAEALALDDEIAFRQAPASVRLSDPFTIELPTPLPVNLLEFPRQLIATRKARPRLAEGPLADEPSSNPQLRIFEVEPKHIARTPEVFSVAPEWANIHLDAHVPSQPQVTPEASSLASLASLPRPQTAPFNLRLMAVAVDLAVIAGAVLSFVGIATHLTHELPTGIPAAIIVGVVFVSLYALYQGLFFTFSDQTPGMRYARIGFCTFQDKNPTRSAIRSRFFALALALFPLGLGVLWALLDEDGLGWHDRISRMYPRPY